MVLLETPICDFGAKPPEFKLKGIDGRFWTLSDCMGPKGLLVMFICNHCPYVKAIQTRLVEATRTLKDSGIHSVAIMANDPLEYPEDSFENMQAVATHFAFDFPYLLDETQQIAKAYGAVCTPDFFGYNAQKELQYRGRLDSSGREAAASDARKELVEAMLLIAETGQGPREQTPSMGCSIKWRDA